MAKTQIEIDKNLHDDYRQGYILQRVWIHLSTIYAQVLQIAYQKESTGQNFDVEKSELDGIFEAISLIDVEMQHNRNRIRYFDRELGDHQ